LVGPLESTLGRCLGPDDGIGDVDGDEDDGDNDDDDDDGLVMMMMMMMNMVMITVLVTFVGCLGSKDEKNHGVCGTHTLVPV
jgi:hypothetical protein